MELMPEFKSEQEFEKYFAKENKTMNKYRDAQGRVVLSDIHNLEGVVQDLFDGHPEFKHHFIYEEKP